VRESERLASISTLRRWHGMRLPPPPPRCHLSRGAQCYAEPAGATCGGAARFGDRAAFTQCWRLEGASEHLPIIAAAAIAAVVAAAASDDVHPNAAFLLHSIHVRAIILVLQCVVVVVTLDICSVVQCVVVAHATTMAA
jgi:hypothetical protein